MKITNILIILIIIASFALGIYLYPQMPDRMASHWNSQGQVDGYMSKLWGLFLMPMVSLAMFLLFLLIPKIDPLKENIVKFRKYFDWFVLIIILFLFYIYILTILWNKNISFNMTQALIPAFAILFYFAGVLIGKAQRNWFIGIRTPWTLSSDLVWDKTHQLGAKLFKTAAIISLIGLFFPKYAFWVMIIPILLAVVYVVIYSYLEYQKEKNK